MRIILNFTDKQFSLIKFKYKYEGKDKDFMKPISYKTNQKETILSLFAQNKDRQFSVQNIVEQLNSKGKKVALATIYRQLDSLEKNGTIRKFPEEDGKKACWQFAGGSEKCAEHYHLKCEKCGKIVHLDCDFVSQIDEHILSEHGFFMDRAKTVFYGTCEKCSS